MKFIECKKFKPYYNDDNTRDTEVCQLIDERVWFFYDAGFYNARKVNITVVYFSETYNIECLCKADELAEKMGDRFMVVHAEEDGRRVWINKSYVTHLGVFDNKTKVYVGKMPIGCTESVEEIEEMLR